MNMKQYTGESENKMPSYPTEANDEVSAGALEKGAGITDKKIRMLRGSIEN